jgi:acyl carrier protein
MDDEKLDGLLAEVLDKPIGEIREIPPTQLLSENGMDSLGFIRFVVLLEEEFGITIDDSDLLTENFGTLEAVQKTLAKYLEGE